MSYTDYGMGNDHYSTMLQVTRICSENASRHGAMGALGMPGINTPFPSITSTERSTHDGGKSSRPWFTKGIPRWRETSKAKNADPVRKKKCDR